MNRDDSSGVTDVALHMACNEGDLHTVRALLDDGASVNGKPTDRGSPYYGSTPLHFARNVEIVRELLDREAEIDGPDHYRATPLNKACRYNYHVDVVRELLDRGANINAATREGHSPLMSAVFVNLDIVLADLLLSRGASVNCVSRTGHTVLHFASRSKNLQLVERLLDGGANIDAYTRSGQTPLVYAIERGSCDVVETLLSRGASTDFLDKSFCTPLQRARCPDIIRALLDAGAEADRSIMSRKTALELACCRLDRDSVELLLSRGAAFQVERLVAAARENRDVKRKQEDIEDFVEFLREFVASIDHPPVMK